MPVIKRHVFSKPIVEKTPCPKHFEKLREVKAITERIDRTNNLGIPDNFRRSLQNTDFKAIDRAIRSSCYSCNGRDCHE